ncbi:helix-turn-helix domain-containing protein [Candidatus Daviesbacteria bacterium]|nr:helix-turn-helix domain-containing protein [Candidatus Daviesbacteria bacterium]
MKKIDEEKKSIGQVFTEGLNRSLLLEEEYLTPEEVAKILKVEKITIYRMCRAGKLPAVKFGKVWRISSKKLREVLEEKFK